MINITSMDLNNLEKVLGGTYGVVYRNNDKAYKIYRPVCKSGYGISVSNPMRRYRKHRINRMIRLNGKLKYTDLCSDVVFVDGEYAGICIPYYDGETLNNLMNSPFELKMDISRQLVRNSQELTRFHIYPYDYKLNNMILVDGEVKILDLDDRLTKYRLLPHPHCAKKAINGLDETIKTFFGEIDRYHFSQLQEGQDIERPRYEPNYDHEGIIRYLDDKQKKRRFIIVDYKLLDEETIVRLAGLAGYKIIVTYPGREYREVPAQKIISDMMSHYGRVFDFVSYEKIDNYFCNHNVRELIEYKGQFVKVR